MPFVPKPKPRPPKRCACTPCKAMNASREAMIHAYRTIIAHSYTREEFQVITRASHAAMLPRDAA